MAIIKTGSKQYVVSPNQTVSVEKLSGAVGDSVTFSDVLCVAEGDAVSVGKPTVPQAKVLATIVEQGRAAKVSVVKFKNKIRYRRNRGHRQPYTMIQIKTIE